MADGQKMDRMTDTLQEIAEAQRATYEAAADNVLSMQRRGMSFAEDGFKLIEMQQGTLKATQRWFADGVGLAKRQQESAKYVQNWMLSGVEAFQRQADQNLELADSVMESVRRQQEGFKTFAEAWTGTYQSFFAPFVDRAEQNVRSMRPRAKNGSHGNK